MTNKLLIFSLVSALAWGVSMYFYKPAVTKGDWWSATVWTNLATMIVILVLYLANGQIGLPSLKTNSGCVLNAAMAGLCGLLGGIFYRFALIDSKVSLAVTITSLYPIVTVAMGVFILGEKLLVQQWLGILVTIVGLVLISVK